MKASKEPRKIHPDDLIESRYSESELGQSVIANIFYDGLSISEAALRNNITETALIKFLDALNTDAQMKIKYGMHQIISGTGHKIIGSSFAKSEPLSTDENDYGNVPKNYLRLGWVYPEEL